MPYTLGTYTVSLTQSMYFVKKKTFISQHTCLIQQLSMVYLKRLSNKHLFKNTKITSPKCTFLQNYEWITRFHLSICTRKQCQKKMPRRVSVHNNIISIFSGFFEVALHNFEVEYQWGECVSGIPPSSSHCPATRQIASCVFSGKKATNFQHVLGEYLLFWLEILQAGRSMQDISKKKGSINIWSWN